MRALWKGAISFGLVNIPVELYPAEEKKEFKLAMLDKRDFSPVGYKRYSKNSGKEIAWNDIIKGYEYDKDQFVVLSDEDFRRANVKASHTIEIQAFVPSSEIPVQYYETPYYLTPTERGQKVYALLRETLRSTGRIAVAQLVLRTTQHLAAIVPVGRVLMMNTLRYADHLRGVEGFELPADSIKDVGVTSKEIELARRLVDDMTEHWKPEEFKDTYHDDLMRRINEKIANGETTQITQPDSGDGDPPQSAQIFDLAALLKSSLDTSAARHKDKEKTGAAAKAKSRVTAAAPASVTKATPSTPVRRPAAKRKTA